MPSYLCSVEIVEKRADRRGRKETCMNLPVSLDLLLDFDLLVEVFFGPFGSALLVLLVDPQFPIV